MAVLPVGLAATTNLAAMAASSSRTRRRRSQSRRTSTSWRSSARTSPPLGRAVSLWVDCTTGQPTAETVAAEGEHARSHPLHAHACESGALAYVRSAEYA